MRTHLVGSTLLVGVVLTWTAALLFALVAARTWRRRTTAEVRLANGAFTLWWAAAASVLFSLGLGNLLGYAGVLDDGLHTAILYARMTPIALALASLMYYFTFLLTGARRAWLPVALAYAAFWAYGIWMLASMGPWTATAATWEIHMEPRNGSWADARAATFGLWMGAPVLVAGLGYISLAVSNHEPLVRYRILLVASGVTVVFAVIVLAFAFAWPAAEWFPLVYQPAGLAAGALSLLAFSPPTWLSERLARRAREATR